MFDKITYYPIECLKLRKTDRLIPKQERYKEHRKNKKVEKRKREEEERREAFGGSDDMAAMMGFSGFGGSKKS